MKKTILTLALTALALGVHAQQTPLWLRHCAISPDGSTIVFSYEGDLFTVPASGGEAHQLTSNAAYDSYPVWSPDGQHIAFASARMGSIDVYVVGKEGGSPTRLTTHSSNEYPITFSDNKHVLYAASIMPAAESIVFPSGQFPQVYSVGLNGGRSQLFSSVPMEDISVSNDGKHILYHDKKGYEDNWRKHHQSSITRDVWMCDLGQKPTNFKQLTTSLSEDRNPVWAPDGHSFYYLSEISGSMNIYYRSLDGNQPRQITSFADYPVRFLSISRNGMLCFGYNGEIYTLREGEQPQKLNIKITKDKEAPELVQELKASGVTDMELSPNGKEIAFIIRGDIYVTSTDYSTTRQITDTPEQERSLSFAPDGRSIVYASERNGLWQIYRTSLTQKNDKYFTYATDLKEDRLTQSNQTSFQPQFSPDGKEVAFLENRTTIRILNLSNMKVRTIMDGKYEYSYQDGDQNYQWSPDSRWILTGFIGKGGWNNHDIALVNASGNGEIHNLTNSGYSDNSGKWVLGGKAFMWQSDKAGFRSHGSWGAEDDWYLMFLDNESYRQFMMTKEEAELADEISKENDKENKSKKDTEKKKNQEPTESVKPLVFDFADCKQRIVRLTLNSSNLADGWLDKKGLQFYYLTRFEKDYDLWKMDVKKRETKLILKNAGAGSLIADKDEKYLYLATEGGIKKIDLSKDSSEPIKFNAQFNYKPYREREYIFDHIWQQVKDKFYVEDLHHTDWEGYRIGYKRFLPHISNNFDFQELLSEMLGELNGSHTGARYFHPGPTLRTASLGIFIDQTYQGEGLRIAEIIKGSPLNLQPIAVKAGDIILKIDGISITANTDYYPLLDGKADKRTWLTIRSGEKNNMVQTIIVKPITKNEENDLLYRRWVERNKQMVDRWSEGKIAYVHVKGMDSPSFRTVYDEVLNDSNRQKKALIVDTRHNGGGWLHDDLCTLLSGKEYQHFVPRGKYIGSDPYNKWLKPSCVLVCEDNYSNAHGFPWVYKTLKIGQLIGAPVPGTMTAVWWERQIDPTIVFGIPQVGCMNMQGQYMENQQLQPDITVYNSPENLLLGEDAQLKRAVTEMLQISGQ